MSKKTTEVGRYMTNKQQKELFLKNVFNVIWNGDYLTSEVKNYYHSVDKLSLDRLIENKPKAMVMFFKQLDKMFNSNIIKKGQLKLLKKLSKNILDYLSNYVEDNFMMRQNFENNVHSRVCYWYDQSRDCAILISKRDLLFVRNAISILMSYNVYQNKILA